LHGSGGHGGGSVHSWSHGSSLVSGVPIFGAFEDLDLSLGFNRNLYSFGNGDFLDYVGWNFDGSDDFDSFEDWFVDVVHFSISNNVLNNWLNDSFLSWDLSGLDSVDSSSLDVFDDLRFVGDLVRLFIPLNVDVFSSYHRFQNSSVMDFVTWSGDDLGSVSSGVSNRSGNSVVVYYSVSLFNELNVFSNSVYCWLNNSVVDVLSSRGLDSS